MKIYVHHETGNFYQVHDGELWAHPIYQDDQVLNLNTDEDLEWACVDGYGEPITHEGVEMEQQEFIRVMMAKLK